MNYIQKKLIITDVKHEVVPMHAPVNQMASLKRISKISRRYRILFLAGFLWRSVLCWKVRMRPRVPFDGN